jgi:hypothetical protein
VGWDVLKLAKILALTDEVKGLLQVLPGRCQLDLAETNLAKQHSVSKWSCAIVTPTTTFEVTDVTDRCHARIFLDIQLILKFTICPAMSIYT